MSEPLPPTSPAARQLGKTAAWLLAPFLLWTGYQRVVAPPPDKPTPDMTLLLANKLAWYEEHKAEFDLVWVGDSRTLCGIHPQLMDPLLGTRSLNLALWAHWFPTQYPFFLDLVDALRPGTTVVWSLGRQNFQPIGESISTQYAIPLRLVPLYLWLGFSVAEMRPNLIECSSLGALLRPTLAQTSRLRAAADAFGQRVLNPPPAPPGAPAAAADPYAEEAQALIKRLLAEPENALAQPFISDGRVTSIEVYRAHGGYLRYELDRAFFRQQQEAKRRSLEHLPRVAEFQPEPNLWALFVRILDLCAARGVRLIVNEIEEAPHILAQPGCQERDRRFMRERVQPEVEARGFRYSRPDYDRLSDEDYFDYNHLNSEGVRRYAPLLAEALRPCLQRPGSE